MMKIFSESSTLYAGGCQLRPYVQELSGLADVYLSAYPNAGLPNAFGGYDETPEMLAGEIGDWAKSGIVNIVGERMPRS